jgi:hypothetical protein
VQCSAVQCSAVQCSAVQCSAELAGSVGLSGRAGETLPGRYTRPIQPTAGRRWEEQIHIGNFHISRQICDITSTFHISDKTCMFSQFYFHGYTRETRDISQLLDQSPIQRDGRGDTLHQLPLTRTVSRNVHGGGHKPRFLLCVSFDFTAKPMSVRVRKMGINFRIMPGGEEEATAVKG